MKKVPERPASAVDLGFTVYYLDYSFEQAGRLKSVKVRYGTVISRTEDMVCLEVGWIFTKFVFVPRNAIFSRRDDAVQFLLGAK